jgi:hypothetical protein
MAAGCESTVFISKDPRKLGKVYSAGAAQAVDACEVSDASSVNVRFSMLDNNNPPAPIKVGTRLPGLEVKIPESFSISDIEFLPLPGEIDKQGYLFPAPDVTCTSDADCTAPFTCGALIEAVGSSGDPDVDVKVCKAPVSVQIDQIAADPLRFTRDGDAKVSHKYLLLFSNGSDIFGLDPERGISQRERSSDADDERIPAALSFLTRLATVAGLDDGESSSACVGYFYGEGELSLAYLPDGVGVDDCFKNVRAGEGLSEGVRLALEDVRSTSNVGARATWSVLNKASEAFDAPSGSRKLHVVILTDGRDNGSRPGDELDAILGNLVENEIIVDVVQLDYPGSDAEDLMEPAPSKRFRAGPVDNLARLACATGGSYQYVPRPDGLVAAFDAIANRASGEYEFEAQVPDLDGLPDGAYRLATTMRVTLGRASDSVEYAVRAQGSSQPDQRLTLFKRGNECNVGDQLPSDCVCREGLNNAGECAGPGSEEPAADTTAP